MCDPQLAWEIGKVVFTVAKESVKAIAAVNAVKTVARNNAKVSEYKAKVAKNNAEIAEENARMERQSGLEEARRQRIKTIQAIGQQQTAMAANGIDITSGTALDVVTDTAELGELDALMIQYNSEKQALNYDMQANNYNNQANLDLLAAKNARTEGNLKAISSGLNSISKIGMSLDTNQVSDKWSSLKNSWNNWQNNRNTKLSWGIATA